MHESAIGTKLPIVDVRLTADNKCSVNPECPQTVSAWAPDLSPESNAFMAKFIERRKVAPGPFHVGTYSVVRSYLKAVEAANTTDSKNTNVGPHFSIDLKSAGPVMDTHSNAWRTRNPSSPSSVDLPLFASADVASKIGLCTAACS